jgi:hypothetical protein
MNGCCRFTSFPGGSQQSYALVQNDRWRPEPIELSRSKRIHLFFKRDTVWPPLSLTKLSFSRKGPRDASDSGVGRETPFLDKQVRIIEQYPT